MAEMRDIKDVLYIASGSIEGLSESHPSTLVANLRTSARDIIEGQAATDLERAAVQLCYEELAGVLSDKALLLYEQMERSKPSLRSMLSTLFFKKASSTLDYNALFTKWVDTSSALKNLVDSYQQFFPEQDIGNNVSSVAKVLAGYNALTCAAEDTGTSCDLMAVR